MSKQRKPNAMFLDVQVDIPFEALYPFDKVILPMQFFQSMFSNNKSALEMSMCQNETAGSQLIFRLVIPKAGSDTEKKVSV